MLAVNDKSTQGLLTAFKCHLLVSGDYSNVNLSLLLVHFLAGLHDENVRHEGFSVSFLNDIILRLQLWTVELTVCSRSFASQQP